VHLRGDRDSPLARFVPWDNIAASRVPGFPRCFHGSTLSKPRHARGFSFALCPVASQDVSFMAAVVEA
jgi:hypothetical protein